MNERNEQAGSTRTLVVLGVVGFLALVLFMAGWSWRNTAVEHETTIPAQYKDNQNIYDNMWKRFREMAKVPAMYADDLKKLFDSAIKSRYGEDGSQALFQWLQEHNPNLDSAVYVQLQRAIEAGRKEFAASQTVLLDKKRAYEKHLRYGFGPVWAAIWGYPTIDLAKYDIVTSDRTEKAFEEKKDKEIDLR